MTSLHALNLACTSDKTIGSSSVDGDPPGDSRKLVEVATTEGFRMDLDLRA